MTRQKFTRRIYRRPAELLDDFHFIWERRPLIRRAMRELIPYAFRERLMMVVTEVNGCRYCSYYHARLSLRAGISQDELRELLAGSIPPDAPQDELPALAYAQHWAESNAHPDPKTRQRLVEIYGGEKAEAIEIVLRMIRSGNLLGNLWDYWLYRLSFGRLGLREGEERYTLS
ncbi:MAG: carboxymuconolactone decarboxylase family protein [Chloroflexota bacterium]